MQRVNPSGKRNETKCHERFFLLINLCIYWCFTIQTVQALQNTRSVGMESRLSFEQKQKVFNGITLSLEYKIDHKKMNKLVLLNNKNLINV